MDREFLFAQRPVPQQSYGRARKLQRCEPGGSMNVLEHKPSRLAAPGPLKSDVGGLLVQHVERFDLASIKSPISTHKYAERAPLPAMMHHADHAHAQMDPADAPGKLDAAVRKEHNLKRRPFQLRHGRRYTRNESYPLPCDLQELHRQNLRTMLACTVFGRAICAPLLAPPTRVLEIGCGAAYWTLRCHQMFSSMGHTDIMYTGLDIAPLAPDLRRQGLNWTFVQHDMVNRWPFETGTFDYIMWKEMSLAFPLGQDHQRAMDECIRVLRVGGTLEIWETDYTIRSILPHLPWKREAAWEQHVAEDTATFPMSSATPFSPTQNRFLKSANAWLDKALSNKEFGATPCAEMATMLLQEPELEDSDFRRIAIPLSELDWEQDADDRGRRARSRGRAKIARLNHDQLAIRETALLTIVQMIESLEPILKEASGKTAEEWSYWWGSMMGSLLTPGKRPLNGECLEIGAWWATKSDGDHS